MMSSNSSNILFSKLDDFITKYYKNQIIKGLLLSLLIVILYFSIISTIEYVAYLPTTARVLIYYASLFLFVLILFYFILYPLAQLFRLTKALDYRKAASIISAHFPEIQDKLLNTIELIDESSRVDNVLLLASIQQRIEAITPLPFRLAISFKSNYRYLTYLLVSIIAISSYFIFFPAVFTDGTHRLLQYNTYFEPAKPFDFNLLNNNLSIEKGKDLKILLKLTGNIIPSDCEIVIGTTSYFMKKESNTLFTYSINTVNNSFDFHFSAANYKSRSYNVAVLSPPSIHRFILSTQCPAYTGYKNVELENIGDISVPEGTKLTWTFYPNNVSNIWLQWSKSDSTILNVSQKNVFSISRNVKQSTNYSIFASNNFFTSKNLISYNVSVIPDLYPSINILVSDDSLQAFVSVFNGRIKDDYGFEKLLFNYTINGSDSVISIPIPVIKNDLKQDFVYAVDFSTFNKGDTIDYHFEIFDNDQINGSKSTRSSTFSFNLPTSEELKQLDNKSTENLENEVKKSIKLSKEIKKDIENIQKKLLNQSTSDWEKKQLTQQLQNKHQQLMNVINQVNLENQKKNALLNKLDESNQQELLQKQKELEQLLSQVLDDELKKMLDQYQELLKQFDKEKFFNQSKEMKYSYDELEKQMDKNLELLKQYDVEKKIQNTIDALKDLKDKQDIVTKNLENKNVSHDDISIQQDELNKKLGDIQDEYKQAIDKNSELDNKMDLQPFDKEFDDVKKSMENSSNSIKSGGGKQKSREQMKNSSDNLKSLAEKMDQMMQMNSEEQDAEDMANLRQILDNLITLSFKEEQLIDNMKGLENQNPKFIQLSKQQLSIKEDFSIVRDSLYELAKRQMQINKPVIKETTTILKSFANVIDGYESRNNYAINTNQQIAMTSINNLSLLLSEVLSSMQQQSNSNSNSQSPGKKQCKNPSCQAGSKPSMQNIKKQQQSMKQQLQQMIDKMKSGKDGKSGKELGQQMSKMLSEQEKYQRMLNELMNNGNFSPDAEKIMNDIKQMMEQNKRDMVNRSISPQTLQRQNQIITRLLEAENAEKKRDIDNERESKSSQNQVLKSPPELSKYKKKTGGEEELLEYKNVKLNVFYKKLYDDYLLHIND